VTDRVAPLGDDLAPEGQERAEGVVASGDRLVGEREAAAHQGEVAVGVGRRGREVRHAGAGWGRRRGRAGAGDGVAGAERRTPGKMTPRARDATARLVTNSPRRIRVC
jgi:hypothetical protein